MKRFIFITFLIFTLILWKGYDLLVNNFEKKASYETSKTIIIPKNISAKTIAAILEEDGVIPSKDLFYWGLRIRKLGGKLRSGEYKFPKIRSPHSVAKILIQGSVLYHRVTIPEGLTSFEIKALLMKEVALKGVLDKPIPEGSLLPETYTFERNESRLDLLRKMKADLNIVLDSLWETRSTGLPFKTKYEALILASIVEKETRLGSERPHIAAVFINRLKKGMPLQTDPTVIYAIELKEKKPFKRTLIRDDLKIISPYNTYLNPGLPPSPICHPGQASLKAVLNPIKSNDLFFVADGTGGHIFSKTYKEHARNHAKWRKIRKNKK